jgi:hypothetical protein
MATLPSKGNQGIVDTNNTQVWNDNQNPKGYLLAILGNNKKIPETKTNNQNFELGNINNIKSEINKNSVGY